MLSFAFEAWAFVNTYLTVLIAAGFLVGAAIIWFRLPVFGHYIGLALVGISCWLLAEAHGYGRGTEACREESLKQQAELARQHEEAVAAVNKAHLAELLREQEATNRIAVEATASKLRDDVTIADLNQKVNDYVEVLRKRPDAACSAGDDDVRILSPHRAKPRR